VVDLCCLHDLVSILLHNVFNSLCDGCSVWKPLYQPSWSTQSDAKQLIGKVLSFLVSPLGTLHLEDALACKAVVLGVVDVGGGLQAVDLGGGLRSSSSLLCNS